MMLEGPPQLTGRHFDFGIDAARNDDVAAAVAVIPKEKQLLFEGNY